MKKFLLALIAFSTLLAGAAQAADDAVAGKKVFAQCAACHSDKKDDKAKKMGPNLFGVVGRPIASVAGFAYGDGMKSHKGNWDDAALLAYIENPKKWEPKTKMAFAGVKDAQKRQNLVAYLKTLK